MTDSCEIDVKVGGSIVISNTEETVTESRKGSIAKEESALEKTSRKRAIGKTVVWKTFKSFVFLICLIFLIIQSVEFFNIYYKYPTTIVTDVTVAKEFKLPAITLCFRTTISFKEFCSYEPDQCEKPRNMEEFCRKHTYDCRNGTTNSKIPKKDLAASLYMQLYLLNDSYNDARLFEEYDYSSKVRTFIENYFPVLKCYSENLHLYRSRSKLKTKKLTFDDEWRGLFSHIFLDQRNIEPFFPAYEPQVLLGIHSPYVPIEIGDLHAIIPGTKYDIYVQLEKEEHLLPPPYQTGCKDNAPSENAEESTSPNSFQMCLDMCRSEYAKAVKGCNEGMSMVSSELDLCYGDDDDDRPSIPSEQLVELQDKQLHCFQNCKQGCLAVRIGFIPPGFTECPRRTLKIFQDKARLLDCNFRLCISGTTAVTGL
ncbi:hypothetical protein AVEN_199745-1 [Araneus ventricosus]|uniref:Uncharacterized protein n=1 Tax=Araneus ventricosus TaxID=182803 RepID=A0A4Y2J5X6_ARAVE|nr:hypothetical protein AVEN_199745-1 [Araneus ventricosus]